MIQTAYFSALPPTLTRLDTSTIKLSAANPNAMSSLPRTLRILDAFVYVDFSKSVDKIPTALLRDWALAPPHLEEIGILSWKGAPLSADWIPKSLVRGQIGGNGNGPVCVLEASSLPAEAEHVSVKWCGSVSCKGSSHYSVDWTRNLPKGIKNFTPSFTRPTYCSPETIAFMPRNLVSLDLLQWRGLDWNALKTRSASSPETSFWPPALTSFKVDLGTPTLGMLSLLPRTVESLLIKIVTMDLPVGYVFEASDLPQNVRQLNLDASVFGHIPVSGTFPPSITMCRIRNGNRGGFSLDVTSKLSNTITTLLLEQIPCNMPYSPTWTLPTSLTQLELFEWDSKLFSLIPNSVTKLTIEGLFASYHETKDDETDLFEALPPSLEELYIYRICRLNGEGFKLSSKLFSSLPHLRAVTIQEASSISSKVLCNLPRHLESLTIEMEALSDEDIPFFPPNLKSLNLGSEPIDWDSPLIQEYYPLKVDSPLHDEDMNQCPIVRQRRASLLS